MGSSGEANKDVDESAGGLVWVRRRNGSWWPGRIVGIDELPKNCMASPRSGTPVKLLGREDASVDWYNLEKSKRIKAFRCGEYDECIEKVKATAATSSKKAVKYARREDAILHALELESARQSIDKPDSCSTMDKSSFNENGIMGSPTTLAPDEKTDHISEKLVGFENKSIVGLEGSHSGVSFDGPNTKEHSGQGSRRKTPNDSEDDGTERTKRVRGLKDLGVGVDSSSKRKRFLVTNVHEFLKKKSRRLQLTKVLESTAMMTVPVMCEPLTGTVNSSILGLSDSMASGLESSESKGSFSVVVNDNSDSTGENGTSLNASEHANGCKQKEDEVSGMGLPEGDSSNMLFDVTLVKEDLAGFSPIHVPCATEKPQVGTGLHSQSSQVETVPLIKEEFNESGSISSGATSNDVIESRIVEGNSKWMLKGKRNLRNTSRSRKHGFKKSMDEDDKSNIYLARVDPWVVGASLISNHCAFHTKSESLTEIQGNQVQDWSTHILHKEPQIKLPTAEILTPQRLLPYRQSRYIVNPKYQASEFPVRVYDPEPNLYDVNLEVRTSYNPQHVPYISLMSKLNGKPVIGHPLNVEVLDYGFCDLLIDSSECNHGDHDQNEYDTNGLEGADMVYEGKPNKHGGKSSKKGFVSLPRGSACQLPKPQKNGQLSKKIRKLSSITGSRKQSVEKKKAVVQKLKGPSVACVPLKVVFSRINAAIN